MTKRIGVIFATASALAVLTAAGPSQAETKLSFLIDNSPDTVAAAEALVAAYEKKAPDVSAAREITSSRRALRPARCPMSSSTIPAR
jgi:ABC-type glycerol-3-phosphate transport system substrate-binding protein